MDRGDPKHQPRWVGDYVLGERIGSGSFAVVWRGTHRHSGEEFAVKEIDKKQLTPKVSENLLKEITILRTINHRNIIRLFDAIEMGDRIYLVLEYCDGGDLATYILRHGKVSEDIARHFMRELAAGLQILHEKHLIHRDLKPQNLLLSAKERTPLLKIGDFGFARSLMPQGLADTLCGSPLYMAPEIIQNQKYDAKADLWSVGAILFQLVTGKPPFNGNSQFQLFQNILTSTELRFPPGALEELHPDCVDLCRRLLRQNPVERLTFMEFFNHRFLAESRQIVEDEHLSLVPPMKLIVGSFSSSTSDERLRLHFGHPTHSSSRSLAITASSVHEDMPEQGKDCDSSSTAKGVNVFTKTIGSEKLGKSVGGGASSSKQPQVSDSMESIEKGYVLVNAHSASVEAFSYYPEASLQASLQGESSTRGSLYPSRRNDWNLAVEMLTKQLADSSLDAPASGQSHGSKLLVAPSASSHLREVQGLTILHPSTRLQDLQKYVLALAELAQEKYNAGLYQESLSVELVVLAIWKEVFQICSSWPSSSAEGSLPAGSSTNASVPSWEAAGSSTNTENMVDFSRPSSVSSWAEGGFIAAVDRAEKSSHHIEEMDGGAEMPDAIEIVFQKAVDVGTSGAVDDHLGNRGSATAKYSKAMLLFSFIMREATSLPLNPPFLLTPDKKKQIEEFIAQLHDLTHFLLSQPSPK